MKCPKCGFKNPADLSFCGKCGTQLGPDEAVAASPTKTIEAPKEELTTGSTFANKYQIIEELGRGGMGRVYKALDTEVNEKVAIKLIKPEIAADKKTIERFRNELKFARKIRHKNVCQMFDLNREDGSYYITMEYVAGEDLKGLIKKMGQLSAGQAISIASQICDGLEEAHKLGVVHRDLKPQNIMIDKEGDARIMDFGIARSIEGKSITGAGVMIGTPDYMSPEQVDGKETDQRSDLYSLGIILYEMVTGQTPFEGDTPFTIGVKHKSEAPKPPKEKNAQIPDDLNQVILRCLEKETENRYQNVAELKSNLSNIQKGFPTTERIKPTKKPLTSKEITVQLSPKKLLIPALIIIAIVVAAVAIWQIFPQKELIKHSIAVISFENQTGDSTHDYLQKIIPNLLITNLEQSGNFKVTTWERMHDLLEQMDKGEVEFIDSNLGFELCRREEIDAIIVGYFTKAGDVFVTDLKVLDVHTKDLLKGASAKGKGVDSILYTQIDDLSKQIAQGFGIPEREIEETLTKITDVTTSSMEAYEYYLEGNEKWARFYLSEAQKLYEKAIELDPGFAAAYVGLGLVQRWQRDSNESIASIKKAMELSSQITEKERLLIEIIYNNMVEQDIEKALELGKQAVAEFPKDKILHLWHAYTFWGLDSYEEAIKEFKIALQLDPNFGLVHNMIAYVYANIEQFDKALEHWKIYASLFPEDANPIDSMGDILFTMGRLDESIAQYKRALEIQEGFYSPNWRLAYIYAFKEDYPEALKWLDDYIESTPSLNSKKQGQVLKEFIHGWLGQTELALRNLNEILKTAKEVENEEWVQRAYRMLAWIHLQRGEFEKSREEFKKWFDSASKRKQGELDDLSFDYESFLCVFDLKQGKIKTARARFEEMKKKQPNFSRPRLQAGILLAEGFAIEAISVWEEDLPITYLSALDPWDAFTRNIWIMSDLVARTHQKQGDIDKAIAEYERLTTFDPESRDRLLIPPQYYYRLAKLYEEKGWAGKAIENYEKFLDLWKDADPIFEEVEDAKSRLKELR